MRSAVRHLSVVATALAGLSIASQAPAQTDPCPKQYSNRCEGLVRRPNASPDFELLALFAGPAPAASVPLPAQLKIQFFRPPGDTVSAFRVSDIVHDTLYQMTPKLNLLNAQPPGLTEFGDWPTADVLRPNQVRVSDLGVLIRLNDPRVPDLLAPALLLAGDTPTSSSAYTIDLKIHKRMASLRCSLIDANGLVLAPSKATCRFNKSAYLPSELMRVHIPFAGLPAGLITAHLSGDYADDESGQRFDLDVRFLHRSDAGGQP